MRAIALLFMLTLAALGQQPKQFEEKTMPNDKSILKVAVFADGRLIVDGTPSSIRQLREALTGLAEHHGAVRYYREQAQHEPPAIAMQAIEAVAAARLPISFSSRPDFSDTVVLRQPR